jgi:chemotaxis protein MotB
MNTIKLATVALTGSLLLTSCVSSKVYKDLEGKYADVKRENRSLKDDLSKFKTSSEEFETSLDVMTDKYASLKAEHDQLESDYNATKQSYDALEANSSKALAENSKQNRALIAELEDKKKALAEERATLDKLKADLETRSNRINELESVIAAKEAKMQALKTAVSSALGDFEGKGLTVEQRNGKVYVSMENKLLFNSGSWAVGSEGRRAVNQLGEVLASNPDIAVLIEGHTDNVPYGGNGPLQDNWDLSTKRATSIVNILRENSQIDPQNLTAAGRGEYLPIASNDSATGKAKNRRIEVILTPKLDEISKLLNDI